MTSLDSQRRDLPPCSKCGMPWTEHYKEGARWKMGPFGTFDLRADHVPHIPGVHRGPTPPETTDTGKYDVGGPLPW